MFAKIVEIIKRIIDYKIILIIIGAGLFTLLVDGKAYKKKGFIREVKIVKFISYSYIAIGGLMYILLLFM